MPKNNENFNSELEGFLRANGFNRIATLDADGEAVPDATEADQFKFDYINGKYNYGTVTITTHNGKVTVYFNESVVRDPEHGVDTNWTKFLMKLKDWALRNGQMGFSVQNLDKLGVDMRKRKMQKKEEKLLEGYYGTRHTSYSDNTPTIKMIIKHSRALDEGDQRYRNIEKIFLENELGERVLVPSKKPSVGRAFARHLAEGGQYNDDRWNHIREIAEDIGKLGGFVRATRSGQFNESVSSVVMEAANHYQQLRETIKRISGTRGYNHYFESWQPTLMETETEQDYASMFSARRLDPRIESAIPVLKKLNITIGELSEATEFESWANSIVEGRSPEMDKNIDDLVNLLQGDGELPVGADAMSIKGQLEDIIIDAEHRDLLFSELDDAARADPDNDAKPAIISWLQKHRDEEFYGDVLDKLGNNEPAPGDEIAKAPEPKKAATTAPPPPGGGAAEFMQPPLAEKAKKPAQRNFVAKHAQRSGAGVHGKQGYQRHPKHKSKLGEEGVAEGLPRNAKEKKLYELLEHWGYFISFKTLDLGKKNAVDQNAQQEIMKMRRHYLGSVMNGMTFGEITKGDLWQNPKVIPHLLKYIYQGIPFIEERIKKFIVPNEQQTYLSAIDKMKALYREVVSQYSGQQGVAEADYSPMAKDSMKADKIRSVKNLIAIAKEQGRQLRVQELELELKKLQGVAETKKGEESTNWRVEQSEATGRYFVVKGYQKRKVWKNSFGSGDFNSKDAAQKKADELNGGVEEGRVQQLPTRGADYSKYDTDHLKMMLRPGILHRDEAKFKALIRKELQKREQQVQQGVAEDKINEFAPNGDSGGDILKTLARNWVAGDMMSGDLNSDIASQEKVESTLRHGIVCPDGVKRKLNIDWNENYDGVVLFDDEDWSIQYNIDRDLSENVMEQSEDMSQIMRIKKLSGL